MAENPYKGDLSHFSVTFVRSVIAWNQAEDAAREILQSVSEGGLGMMAAVAHLGSRGLHDSLATVADHWDNPEYAALQESARHIKHYIAGMDTLRAYRNFYVHSLIATGKKPNSNEFRGFLTATEARGKYAWVRQYVSTHDLVKFMRHCLELAQYGQHIAANLRKGGALSDLIRPSAPFLSSLEKPTWPEKLTKNRDYLQALRPQPESSEE